MISNRSNEKSIVKMGKKDDDYDDGGNTRKSNVDFSEIYDNMEITVTKFEKHQEKLQSIMGKIEQLSMNLESSAKGHKDAARRCSEEISDGVKSLIESCRETYEEATTNLREIRRDRFQIAVALARKVDVLPTPFQRTMENRPTYANVLRRSDATSEYREPKPNHETLIIKASDSEKTLQEITRKIKPEEEKIKVMDCKNISSKKLIIMKFGTKEEQQKMKNLIETNKIENCEAKLATKLDPTIRITNIYNLSEEDIKYGIRKITGNDPVGVNILQRAKTRRAFIRLKKMDYQTLTTNTPNELFVGFYRLRYELFVAVSKCKECYQMGHSAEICRNKKNDELKNVGKIAEEANK